MRCRKMQSNLRSAPWTQYICHSGNGNSSQPSSHFTVGWPTLLQVFWGEREGCVVFMNDKIKCISDLITMWVRIESFFEGVFTSFPGHLLLYRTHIILPALPYTLPRYPAPLAALTLLQNHSALVTVPLCPSHRVGPEEHMFIQLQRAEGSPELKDPARK